MSTTYIKLKIITPDSVIYESDDISSINLPTIGGEITVKPDHIPLVTIIKTGAIRVTKGGEVLVLAVSAGVLEVRRGSEVILLAENTEMAHLIDIERAESAHRRAEEIQKTLKEGEDVEGAQLAARVAKELNRIRVAKKWRG